ncbi:proline iminopeptidase-family hydrolase [Streptomyces sp. NPDC053755]|uniref:proline iminopeptidase-family hydrolase n=1 Tax=Streptomyces sp. NPDC053755 TaxID=3155815 RepID=UPI003415242B
MADTEGTVPFRGHHTWYRVVGALPTPSGRPPLLVVHGGPGLPHDYLEDLAALAEEDGPGRTGEAGRTVVFYDQLGCGRSDQPDDPALWTMDTFVAEVDAVRRALGLDRVHLLGHSWGTQVLLEYMLRKPSGVASLVLASPIANAPAYAAEARRLKDSLPPGVREVIDRCEAAGTTDDDAYLGAAMEFYQRWLCRLDPWPEHVVRSVLTLREEVDTALWGPEWNVTGSLREWDVSERLSELDLPVLLTSGRYDVVVPDLVRPMAEAVPGAAWVLFEDSAHLATAEEPEHYRQVLGRFLSATEKG